MANYGYEIKLVADDSDDIHFVRVIYALGRALDAGLEMDLQDGLERTVNCIGVDVSIVRTREEVSNDPTNKP
jgi:hypothetical protein